MSQEQKQILEMLNEGRISVEEAERLLNALSNGRKTGQKRVIATAGATRKSLGSSLDSIGEAIAGIGPIITEAVGEATAGLGSVEVEIHGYEEDDLEPVELDEQNGFEIESGRELVIRCDHGADGSSSGIHLKGAEGNRCEVPEDGAEQARVFRGPDFDLIRWSGSDLRLVVPETVSSVTASTLGGDVTTEGLGCGVVLKTLGGNMELRGVRGEFRAKTLGGSIGMSIIATPEGHSRASTMGGDIRLRVSEDCSFRLRAKTMGGSIQIDPVFGEAERAISAPHGKATILIGGEDTGATISLKTAGGNIVVLGEGSGEDDDE